MISQINVMKLRSSTLHKRHYLYGSKGLNMEQQLDGISGGNLKTYQKITTHLSFLFQKVITTAMI